MEKWILYKKTKGTEFNSSDEEKFLRRLNQNRVPHIFWCRLLATESARPRDEEVQQSVLALVYAAVTS